MKQFLVVIVGFLLWSAPALAQVNIGLGQGGTAYQIGQQVGFNPETTTDTSLSASIGKVIRVVLSMVGVLFLALTVYAGILWMTASGNEEKVETATKILRSAAIGLVILLGAYGITALVLAGVGFATQPQAVINEQNAQDQKGFWSQYGGYLQDSALRMLYMK